MIIERFKTLAQKEVVVDWLVDGLMTTGEWTYFVGEAGVGKSMLLIQLCANLQKGEDFLGFKAKQRNCLYVQVDTGRLEWKTQIKAVAGDSFAWTLYAAKSNFLDDEEEVERIRQVVWGDYPEGSPYHRNFYPALQGQKFDLVIFDVLNKMTAQDLNTKPSMSFVIDRLARITRRGEAENEESVHYILVHHPNKSTKRGVNAGSGYGGFGGICGNMMTLYSEDRGLSGLLTIEKTKVTAGKVIEIVRNPNGSWKVKQEDYSDYDKMFEGE